MSSATARPTSMPLRLALSPDEAAAALGVSRDFLDEHVAPELLFLTDDNSVVVYCPACAVKEFGPRRHRHRRRPSSQ